MIVDVARFAFYVLLPLWALAGLGDYLCHRASHIERTPFGAGEALLHLLQWAQIVAAVSLLAWLPSEPVALAFAAFCVVAHSATAWWDEYRTRPQRCISTAEHYCHAYLIALPVAGLLRVVWAWLQPVPSPAPASPGAAILAMVYAAFAVAGLLIAEGWLRCRRQRGVPAAAA
ncbi:hypothetical protein [Tahibacter caeni]|uniref:hypothetical protein n=1 Tax=Tahibacter caeni TaxID=1453545 RepID=UPI0021476CC4|nr:hypothetical protein [Tahibacter caeni]